MPISDKVIEHLASHYGKVPLPNQTAFRAAEAYRDFLAKEGFTAPGVVGVAYSNSHWYIGHSAGLAKEINEWYGSAASGALIKGFTTATGTKARVWICFGISDEMAKAYTNPGCAEKKIIHECHRYNDTLIALAIVAFPANNEGKGLTNYEAIGTGEGIYLAPCEGCQSAAAAYLSGA